MVNQVSKVGCRIIAAVMIISLLTALGLQSGRLDAEQQENGIRVQSRIGYQGSMKEMKWYPVRLTLTNETDADLKGELVLSVSTSGMLTTDYVVPAELPRQTAVEVTISIPGDVLKKDSNKLRFFKGSYKEGRTVPIIGNDYLEAKLTNSYTIGVIARDPDTLNFMPSLNLKGYNISVFPMAENELPEEGILLSPLDALIINDVATAGWSERRMQAITDWVKLGGTLVLSGGAGYGKTAEAFKAIMPVQAGGTTVLSGSEALAAAGGTELKSDSSVTVSLGEVIEGQIEFSEHGIPLAVTRLVGLGSVVYAAFDPSLDPLSSWSGSATLWARLLQRNLSPLQPGMMVGSDNFQWNLRYLIDQFPSIKPPDFIALLIMFALYMLIVAPALYILLSKVDRREWSWWLIPALSIVMGATIFFIGSGDKRVMSTHTIEIIELTPGGEAIASGATGLFIPAGGTVMASFDEKLPLKMYSDGNQMNSAFTLDGDYQIYANEEQTKALWRSVSYWSTRKLWIDRHVRGGETGTIKLDYEHSGGDTLLNVTNDTTADMTHMTLIMDGQALPIGDLKKGEQGQVRLPPASVINGTGYYNYSQMIFPYSSGSGYDEWDRQRQLVDLYMNRGNSGMMPMGAVVVGFSIDHDPLYKVNGNAVKADNLKMWIRKLDILEREGNRIIVPAGAVQPIIISSTLQGIDLSGGGNIRISPGELVLEYMAPNSSGVVYDQLEVMLQPNQAYPEVNWSIWQEASGEWIELGGSLNGNAQEYLIHNQRLQIKLESSTEISLSLPLIKLEGEELQQ